MKAAISLPTMIVGITVLIGALLFLDYNKAYSEDCISTAIPTVTTDKEDYDPGEIVFIKGSGFECDATLTVTVSAPDGSVVSDEVASDKAGEFTHTYQIPLETAEGEYALEVLDTDGNILASTLFYDSHFRFGHLTYVKTGPTSVNFILKNGFRRGGYVCRNAPSTAIIPCTGPPQVGTTPRPGPGDYILETIGATGLLFGDGTATGTLLYRVDAINVAGDWLLATALQPGTTNTIIPKTYSSAGSFTAMISSCCRTGVERNNPNQSYRVETIVNLIASNTGSPSSSLPAIVDCLVNSVCSFNIPATNPDRNTIVYRFSTSAESGLLQQPGPPQAPNAATINPDGVYTWNTSGASGGTGALYSTQVIIEERHLAGNLVSKSAIDFLIRLVEAIEGSPPVFDVGPSPAAGADIRALVSQSISFEIQASDLDDGDFVTIGHLGLPPGATFQCQTPGNPTICEFDWTPGPTNAGEHTVTFVAADQTGLSATPHEIKITVLETPAPEDPSTHKVIFVSGIYSGTTYEDMDDRLRWLRLELMTADVELSQGTGLKSSDFHFFNYDPTSAGELIPGESYSNAHTCWTIDDHGTVVGQSTRLAQFVKELVQSNPDVRQVSILAHSQGGVIATYAARMLEDVGVDLAVVTFDSPLHGASHVDTWILDKKFGLPGSCSRFRDDLDNPNYHSPVDMRMGVGTVQRSPVIDAITQPLAHARLFTINADPGWFCGEIFEFTDFSCPVGRSVDPATIDWRTDHTVITTNSHSLVWGPLVLSLSDYPRLRKFIRDAIFETRIFLLEPEFRSTLFALNAGSTGSIDVAVGSQEVTFAATWPTGTVNTTLVAPDGTVIDPRTVDPNVHHEKGPLYELYRIQKPQSGIWQIRFFGAHIPPGGVDVDLRVSVLPDGYPPQISAGPDQVIVVGEGTNLPPATFSHPGGVAPHVASIDWGDGTVEGGVLAQAAHVGSVGGAHTYTAIGKYTVEVCVSDATGLNGCDTFQVSLVNESPIVDAGPDRQVGVESTLEMMATFTTTGTPGTHMAFINWGDGSDPEAADIAEVEGSGTVTGSHIYTELGPYEVEICVTYDGGGTGCDVALVEVVENQPPTADAGGPYEGDEGSPITIDASESSDPDPGDTLTYSFDCADDGTFEIEDQVEGTFDCTYGDNGEFTVRVRVKDSGGLADEATATVIVNNIAPAVTLDTSTAIAFPGGDTFLGRKNVEQSHEATATDPGADDLTFTWDFGVTNAYLNPGGVFPFSATDPVTGTFTAAGLTEVSVEVADDDGGVESDSLPKLVTDDSDCARSQAFWRHQFSSKKGEDDDDDDDDQGQQIDDATLQAYLDMVNFASGVFSEQVAAATIDEARAVFRPRGEDDDDEDDEDDGDDDEDDGDNDDDRPNRKSQATRQALAAWLNFASGAVLWDEAITVHFDDDDEPPVTMPFHEVMAQLEAILINTDATHQELERAKDLAESVNLIDEENEACDDDGDDEKDDEDGEEDDEDEDGDDEDEEEEEEEG